MNPKNMKQYQNLLYYGVSQKKRGDVRGSVSTQYMDPQHVAFMELTVPGSREIKQYIGTEEKEMRVPLINYDDVQTLYLSVAYLKRIVDNITAKTVLITVQNDKPITFRWCDGNDHWRVMLAPEIMAEDMPEVEDI